MIQALSDGLGHSEHAIAAAARLLTNPLRHTGLVLHDLAGASVPVARSVGVLITVGIEENGLESVLCAHPSWQWRARCHGIPGINGSGGIVGSATYRV